MSQDSQNSLRHVAIIMDGNGRWAEQRHLPRVAGHNAGAEALRRAVRFADEQGIASLTVYAFSSENWRRPPEEVSGLMKLFMTALKREIKRLAKKNVRIGFIGDLTRFDETLQRKMLEAAADTQSNSGLRLNIAVNYGGYWDITQAARYMAQQVADGKLTAAQISEQDLAAHMMLADQPAIDLMIRTGGEQRISNYLLWQLAYAELYFCDTLWPDFSEQQFADACSWYYQRERRFGQTGAQVRNN